MSDCADRIQSQSFDAHGKCIKRGLAADLDLTCIGNRLAESYVQLAILSFAADFPGDNVATLDVKDLSRTVQQNAERFQFALKNLEVDLVILTQQASADVCIDVTGSCKEEFSLSSFASGFPLQSGTTSCRQESQPCVVVAQRHDRFLVSMKFQIRIESVQRQGNNRASGNREIHTVPIALECGHCADKIECHCKRSRLGKYESVNRALFACRKPQPIVVVDRHLADSRIAGKDGDFRIGLGYTGSAAKLELNRFAVGMQFAI